MSKPKVKIEIEIDERAILAVETCAAAIVGARHALERAIRTLESVAMKIGPSETKPAGPREHKNG